jgi:hypothetical protein
MGGFVIPTQCLPVAIPVHPGIDAIDVAARLWEPSYVIRVPSVSEELAPIAKELHRLHESLMWSSQVQFEQMKLWRAMNILLGTPAAVLAAASGGTGLASGGGATVPSVLALIAAGFGAALTTLNPSRRVSQAQASANAYLELQTEARQFLLIDVPTLSAKDAREHLTQLTARRDEVNKTADPPGAYARWRATRNLKSGGQTYEVDSEGA